jgi:centrosomal CEP192-like protein
MAQSLGDVAREERQKKTSAAQGDAAKQKVFSNLDDPQAQAVMPNGQTPRKAGQGGQQRLQIESPPDGTVVHPGETIKVRVTSSTDRTWSSLLVVSPVSGLPSNVVTQSVPAELAVTIPSDVDKAGQYPFTAMGTTTSGELVESASITLDVERPDMPVSLWSQFESLIFEAKGQSGPMMLTATFSDGKVLEVTESPNVTYRSTDTKVVTVDEAGTATAVETGTAAIIVSYKNPNGPDLRLTIPVTVERFQVTFSPSSLDFGNVRVGSSASLSVTATNNAVSDSQLMIKAVSTTGPYLETNNCVSSSPLALDATCQITVTFTPTAPGKSPGTLSIPNSSSGVPSVILMSGIGVK